MKSSWPRVECRVSKFIDADHSLPKVGFAETHRHNYWIEFGYCHEINVERGVTKSMQEMMVDVDKVIEKIKYKNLNEVLPVTPTAEFLACWILSQLPEYWDFVIIRCYGGFECRIDRKNITTNWIKKLNEKN
jgi:6-pyruvoyl-tetrahydropterin synthase